MDIELICCKMMRKRVNTMNVYKVMMRMMKIRKGIFSQKKRRKLFEEKKSRKLKKR